MRPLVTNDLSNMSTAKPIPTQSAIGHGPLGWYEGVLLMKAALFTTIVVSRRWATMVRDDFLAITSKFAHLIHTMKHLSSEPLGSLPSKFLIQHTLHWNGIHRCAPSTPCIILFCLSSSRCHGFPNLSLIVAIGNRGICPWDV
jgi:hypothetical protein